MGKFSLTQGSDHLAGESGQRPVRITFSFTSDEHQQLSLSHTDTTQRNITNSSPGQLQALLWSKSLYIQVTDTLVNMSKEVFVNLLEYAEEELECENVILCIPKSMSGINLLIRMFMYFGFVKLAPDALPIETEDTLYMITNFK